VYQRRRHLSQMHKTNYSVAPKFEKKFEN